MVTKAAPSPKQLQEWAAGYQHDNHAFGDPGYCNAIEADWVVESVDPSRLANVFASKDAARKWIESEIQMDSDEGLNRNWAALLQEPIEEEVFILMRDGKAYVWDGFHRIAASIALGNDIKAIVGYPRPAPSESSAPQKSPRPMRP